VLNGIVKVCGSYRALTEVQSVGNFMEAILLCLLLDQLHLFGRKKHRFILIQILSLCVYYVSHLGSNFMTKR
jgi:hypothetical protein